MKPVIRDAHPDDHDALVEQFLGLNIYEDAIAADRRTDLAGAADSLAMAWKRVTDTQGAALVAVLGGRVVGHLFLAFERDAVFIREHLREHAYVSELFVRAEARHAGVGKALMQHAEGFAVARGSRRLMVGVLIGNTPAESLYAQLGFVPSSMELKKRIGLDTTGQADIGPAGPT